MSLRAQIRDYTPPPVKRGFQLEEPATLHFRSVEQFHSALQAQEDAWAPVPAAALHRIDVDGRIEGSDLKLSRAAFADVCQFTGTPIKFINQLAMIDPEQALDVMQTMLGSVFHAGTKKTLMVDTRCDRVEGIVGTDTYSPLSNRKAADYLLSALPGLELASGWLNGPSMRATALLMGKPREVRKGDIIHVGVSIENAVHGDRSLKVRGYNERLVCTNGMTAMREGHVEQIIHRGDIEFAAAQAVIRTAKQAEEVVLLAKIAAERFMFATDIRAMQDYLTNAPAGGVSVASNATRMAQEEAEKEGRAPEETTLWNWVNAVTEQTHAAPSLPRQMALEGLGHSTLFRFAAN